MSENQQHKIGTYTGCHSKGSARVIQAFCYIVVATETVARIQPKSLVVTVVACRNFEIVICWVKVNTGRVICVIRRVDSVSAILKTKQIFTATGTGG